MEIIMEVPLKRKQVILVGEDYAFTERGITA